MRFGRAALAILAVSFALVSCAQHRRILFLADQAYVAAHGADAIASSIKLAARRTAFDISFVVVPAESADSAAEFYRQLRLTPADSVIVTPLLATDATVLSRLVPGVRVGVIGGAAGAPGSNVRHILFDSTQAMRELPVHLARLAQATPPSIPHRVAVFFVASTDDERSQLAAFRGAVPRSGETEFAFHVFDSPPSRDDLRSVLEDEKGRRTRVYAFFTHGLDAYCMELLKDVDVKVALSGAMASAAYPGQVACAVERPLADAISSFARNAKQTLNVPALLVCSDKFSERK